MYTPENLSPEKAAFRPLNDLLVDRLWWMVHQHRTSLVVDLSIHPCISNEIDNPLLAFILVEP